MAKKNLKIYVGILAILVLVFAGVWFYNKYQTSTELSKSEAALNGAVSGSRPGCPLGADVNSDGKVDSRDYALAKYTMGQPWAVYIGHLDLNGDNLITYRDSQNITSGPSSVSKIVEWAVNSFLGKTKSTSWEFKVSDINGDGTVSIGEVQKAINFALSLVTNMDPVRSAINAFLNGNATIGQVQRAINNYLRPTDIEIAMACYLNYTSSNACKKADIDNSGSVSIGEVQKFIIAARDPLAPKILLRTDINKDGLVNDADLLLITGKCGVQPAPVNNPVNNSVNN